MWILEQSQHSSTLLNTLQAGVNTITSYLSGNKADTPVNTESKATIVQLNNSIVY